MPQTGIPCVLMSGGTSKGPYFLADDLPLDPHLRDRVLLAGMGSVGGFGEGGRDQSGVIGLPGLTECL